MTDGDVATDGHQDRQPSARHQERVDHAVAVQCVQQVEPLAGVVGEALLDEAVRQDGDAEAEVGHGERDEARVDRSLHAPHDTRKPVLRQHPQVQQVTEDAEDADDDDDVVNEEVAERRETTGGSGRHHHHLRLVHLVMPDRLVW